MVGKQKQPNKSQSTHSDRNDASQWESTKIEVGAQFLINTQTLQKQSHNYTSLRH